MISLPAFWDYQTVMVTACSALRNTTLSSLSLIRWRNASQVIEKYVLEPRGAMAALV